MSQLHPATPRKPKQVLAWSALVATAVALATLMQAAATSALVAPLRAAATDARLSVATAALADGDDVRARFLASLPDGAIDAASVP